MVTGDWSWFYLSQNVPIEDIRQNPGEKWNRYGMYENPGVTLDILRNMHVSDWRKLSRNVPIDVIG